MSARRLVLVAVVLVLVLVLAWIVMFATKGDTDSAYPAHPERVAESGSGDVDVYDA